MRALINRLRGKLSANKETEVKAEPPASVPTPTPVRPAAAKPQPRPAPPKPAARPAAPAPQAQPVKRAPRVSQPQPAVVHALQGSAQTQSDFMLLMIGKTAKTFMAHAQANKWITNSTTESFLRPDVTAALLACRLMLTAYKVHQEQPSREALRFVRTAMTSLLHRAGQNDERQAMIARTEELLKAIENDTDAAAGYVRAKSATPFEAFYARLLPAFGEEASNEVLHQRFGALLHELYVKIEAAMAARNVQITG